MGQTGKREHAAHEGSAPEVKAESARDARMFLAGTDMTHKAFADMIGLGECYLSQVLRGRVRYSPLLRIRIEKGLSQITQEQSEATPETPPTPRIRRL